MQIDAVGFLHLKSSKFIKEVIAKFYLELTSSTAMIVFQDICYSQWMSTRRNNHLLSELLS